MKYNNNFSDIELSSGGGTINLSLTEYVEVYNITGSGTLAGNYVIQANPAHTPKKGMVLNFLYNATMTLATNNITICGQQLTAGQAAKKCIIQAVYSGSAWVVFITETFSSAPFGMTGVNINEVPAIGATYALVPGKDKQDQILVGAPTTLTSNVTVGSEGGVEGDTFRVRVDGDITLDGNLLTIYGISISAADALAGGVMVEAIYDGSAWQAILIDPTPSIIFDVITGAGLDTDGSYIVNEEANYIDEATSIADATDILDTKAKDLEDRMVEVEKALFGYFDIIIPHEEILTLNTVEVDVTAEAGADQVFIVTELAVKFYCLGTAYETNTSFGLKYSDGGATFLPIGTGLLESTSSVEYLYNGAANFSVNNYIGKKIVAFVETGDPTGGEAGQYVRIKGTYKIIEFDEA